MTQMTNIKSQKTFAETKWFTIGWVLFDWSDDPATFTEPGVANSIACLTMAGSGYLTVSICIEVQRWQEKSGEKKSSY